MKMSHFHHELANLEELHHVQIRARALDIRADKFARDLDALVRALVYTALLARLLRSLSEPPTLAPCLDRMSRLANNAVRLVRQLREYGLSCPSKQKPARSGRSRSIPVSPWKVVTFQVQPRAAQTRRGQAGSANISDGVNTP